MNKFYVALLATSALTIVPAYAGLHIPPGVPISVAPAPPPPPTIPDLVNTSSGSLPAVDPTVRGNGQVLDSPAYLMDEPPYAYTEGANYYVGGWGNPYDAAGMDFVKYCIKSHCVNGALTVNPRTGRYGWVVNLTSLGATDGVADVGVYPTPTNGIQGFFHFPIILDNNGTLRNAGDAHVTPTGTDASTCTSGAPCGHILWALGSGHVADGGHVYVKCDTNAATDVYVEDQSHAGTGFNNTKTITVQCEPSDVAAGRTEYTITRTNAIDASASGCPVHAGECILPGINKIWIVGATIDTSKIRSGFKMASGDLLLGTNFHILDHVKLTDPQGTDGPAIHYKYCDSWFNQSNGPGYFIDGTINMCTANGAVLYRNTTMEVSYDSIDFNRDDTMVENVISTHSENQQINIYGNCDYTTCVVPTVPPVFNGTNTVITLDASTVIPTNGAADAVVLTIRSGANTGTIMAVVSYSNATHTITVAGNQTGLSIVGQQLDFAQQGHSDALQNVASTLIQHNRHNIVVHGYRSNSAPGTLWQPMLWQTLAAPLAVTIQTDSVTHTNVTFNAPVRLWKHDSLRLTTGQLENHVLAHNVLAPTFNSATATCNPATGIVTATFNNSAANGGSTPPISTGDVLIFSASDNSSFNSTGAAVTMATGSTNQLTYSAPGCSGSSATGNLSVQDASGGTAGVLLDGFSTTLAAGTPVIQVKTIDTFAISEYLVDGNNSMPELAQFQSGYNGSWIQSTFMQPLSIRNDMSQAYSAYHVQFRDSYAGYTGATNSITCGTGCGGAKPNFPPSNEITFDSDQVAQAPVRGTNGAQSKITFVSTGIGNAYVPASGQAVFGGGYKGNAHFPDGTPIDPTDINGVLLTPGFYSGATH